jgi:hypothetical protein
MWQHQQLDLLKDTRHRNRELCIPKIIQLAL